MFYFYNTTKQKKKKNYAKGKQIITIQKKSQYCLGFITAINERLKKMVAANASGFNGFTWPTECPTIKIKYPWSIALHWPGQLINMKVQSPSLMKLFHLPLFLFNMSLPCRFYVIQGRAKAFPAIQHQQLQALLKDFQTTTWSMHELQHVVHFLTQS